MVCGWRSLGQWEVAGEEGKLRLKLRLNGIGVERGEVGELEVEVEGVKELCLEFRRG